MQIPHCVRDDEGSLYAKREPPLCFENPPIRRLAFPGPRADSAFFRFGLGRGFEVAEALQDGAYYQRKGYGGVVQDFGEAAAFFCGDEFAPGDGFGVGAAGEAAPVYRLGADADSVAIALQRNFFVAAARQEFGIDAELLGPVSAGRRRRW